ncbi:MAG: hypothetical protein AAGE59_14630 [Cyanobacteria bacterium P01_F01_bin.86]
MGKRQLSATMLRPFGGFAGNATQDASLLAKNPVNPTAQSV